jgi:MarR family transcriptional regulator, organic hydroperoxide resistance regulator
VSAFDQMVCFSLYSASRATTQAYRRLLAPWGLTYPQYLVLVALWTEGPRTVGELGDDLMLDSGTLSPLLRRLEKQGVLTRTRRAGDERVVEVALTARGEELRDEMRDVPGQVATCMGIGIDAARALIDSLHGLSRNVRESSEVPAS